MQKAGEKPMNGLPLSILLLQNQGQNDISNASAGDGIMTSKAQNRTSSEATVGAEQKK